MTFSQRVIGAAKLDVRTYEEVENDLNATGQALGVVVLSTVARGIGSARFGMLGFSVLGGIVGALIGWLIWGVLAYFIGVYLIPEPETKADVGELLRTIGFASSPGILRVFGFLLLLGQLLSAVAAIWMMVAMVVAIRQALDYKSAGRAIAVCVIGWLISLGAVAVFGAMFFLSAGSLLF